jgi:hypothetical protein
VSDDPAHDEIAAVIRATTLKGTPSMNNSKVALLMIGCAAATLQPGAALSEIFHLKHGTYVSSNVPCGQASFGTMDSYDGKGITVGHFSCNVTVLNTSGNTYKVSSICHSERDNSTVKHMEVYTITSDTSFRVKNEYGEFSSRYCERSSLPSPWGDK